MPMKKIFVQVLLVAVLFSSISCSKAYYAEKYGADSEEAELYEFLEGEWEPISYNEWGYDLIRDETTGELTRVDYADSGPIPRSHPDYYVVRFENNGFGSCIAANDPELEWILGLYTPYYVYDENKLNFPLFYGDVADYVTIEKKGTDYMQVTLDDVGYIIDCDEHDGFFLKHKASCKDYNYYTDFHQRVTFRRIRKVIVATPPDGWMTYVKDNALLTQLSIPGTHASATVYGLHNDLTSLTQKAKIESQWAAGVRAFDFTVSSDGGLEFNGNQLNSSFEDMIDVLKEQLQHYKQETAIVFVRPSENAYGAPFQQWKDYVGDVIEDLGEVAAVWRPNMTMRDVRGRILFIMNEAYSWDGRKDSMPGAVLRESEGVMSICSPTGGTTETLYLQADKDMTDAEKLEAVLSNMQKSMRFNDVDVKENSWMVNSLSVANDTYLASAMNIFPMVNLYLSGAEVSQTINGETLEKTWKKKDDGPLGIVFMDFATYDEFVEFENLEISPAVFTEAIIENNFKYTMKTR